MVADIPELCQVAATCGQDEWLHPVVTVWVEDAGGFVASESRVIVGGYKIVDGVCP